MPSRLGGALAIALVVVAVADASAAARVTGRESARGQIIAVARNGQRTVVSSIVVLRGVFNGAGRIVEVPNQPGDPDNASRDNLIFAAGTLRLISFNEGQPKLSLDPKTCVASLRIRQTAKVIGGTRRFRHAGGTFKSVVRAHAVLARNPDGSCDQQGDALLDGDVLSSRGTMSL